MRRKKEMWSKGAWVEAWNLPTKLPVLNMILIFFAACSNLQAEKLGWRAQPDDPLLLFSNTQNTTESRFSPLAIHCLIPQIFILASLYWLEYESMLEISAKKIPVLSRMAGDIFSILAMSSEMEHVFSAAQKTIHQGCGPLHLKFNHDWDNRVSQIVVSGRVSHSKRPVRSIGTATEGAALGFR